MLEKENCCETKHPAHALLAKWKKRLGLDNWVISFYPECKPNDMCLEDVAGCCEWSTLHKTATIQVLSEQYYTYPNNMIPYDVERIIVHELLHIKFAFLYETEDELRQNLTHQLIEEMARALVDSDRC